MASEASITYRYKCSTEGVSVYEVRLESAPIPTVCVNEGSPLVPESLTIVDRPDVMDDADFLPTGVVDFNDCTVHNFSHTHLTDRGNHTHAAIDTHLDDGSKHRTINDSGTGSTVLWSASKISSQLASKAATSHSHTASNVSDFQTSVTANSAVVANTAKTSASGSINTHSDVSLSNVQTGEVLKWNGAAFTNQVDASGGGSGGSHAYFSAYMTSNFSVGSNWTDMLLQVRRHIDTEFSHTINKADVTINESGTYFIYARCSTTPSSYWSSSRTQSRARVMRDQGVGYNEIPGSYAYMYNRMAEEGSSTGFIFIPIALQSGDKIKVQAEREHGSSSLYFLAHGCELSIVKN